MVISVGSKLLEVSIHLDRAGTIPHEERKEEEGPLTDTFAVVQYKEKESRHNQIHGHRKVKTVDDNDNELDTD